jgi:Uma2 family endonuclease
LRQVLVMGKMMTIATPDETISIPQVLLNVRNVRLRVTAAEFDLLCQLNPDMRLELTTDGELIVMPPTGGETGSRNTDLTTDVNIWNRQTQLGKVFDSSTGYDFTSFGGGKLSPDVSWIEKSRLEGVDISGFIPVVPDFVIELRSKTDAIKDIREKMAEYQRLGVRLGWLINPQDQQVEIYRQGRDVETLTNPAVVSGEDVLAGFTLELEQI